jgi:hypothetical protein
MLTIESSKMEWLSRSLSGDQVIYMLTLFYAKKLDVAFNKKL